MIRMDKYIKQLFLVTGLHFRQCRTVILKRNTKGQSPHLPWLSVWGHVLDWCRSGVQTESGCLTECQQNVEEEGDKLKGRPLKSVREFSQGF